MHLTFHVPYCLMSWKPIEERKVIFLIDSRGSEREQQEQRAGSRQVPYHHVVLSAQFSRDVEEAAAIAVNAPKQH